MDIKIATLARIFGLSILLGGCQARNVSSERAPTALDNALPAKCLEIKRARGEALKDMEEHPHTFDAVKFLNSFGSHNPECGDGEIGGQISEEDLEKARSEAKARAGTNPSDLPALKRKAKDRGGEASP